MKKLLVVLLACALIFTGCSNGLDPDSPEYQAQVDSDFAVLMEAINNPDADAYAAMKEFDRTYGTNLADEMGAQLLESRASSGKGSGKNPSDWNVPFNVDGAVYLCGGTSDLVGTVVDWASPHEHAGGFYHGAVLDLDDYDPNNEAGSACLQTAIASGAGYENAADWRTKDTMCVLVPAFKVDHKKLDEAQAKTDVHCTSTNQKYGFFEDTANIMKYVKKSDNYWWYCTKVVWKMWDYYGINVDSNSPEVDYRKCGVYNLVKAYYTALHPFNSSKRNQLINDYLAVCSDELVVAEEIWFSPYLTEVYRNLR